MLITLLAVLIATIKNRVFMGFSGNFYPVTYYVNYLVRLLVGSVLDQFVNARKVAYLRGFSGFAALLICLLTTLLIVNKKSRLFAGIIILFIFVLYYLFDFLDNVVIV